MAADKHDTASMVYQPLQGAVSQRDCYQTLRPTTPMSSFIDSFWQLDIPNGAYQYRSMPDACVDWIFDLDKPSSNFLIAPFVSSRIFTLQGPTRYFGIRFRPLGHSAIYPFPLNELREDQAITDALAPRGLNCLFDALALSQSFQQRCSKVSDAIPLCTVPMTADRRLGDFLHHCYRHYYLGSVSDSLQLSDRQCNAFGLSARQLRRLCNSQLGMGPKQFSRVLRFQSAIRSLAISRGALAQQHYCDQSHMIREFNAMGGLTPKAFLNVSVLSNTG